MSKNESVGCRLPEDVIKRVDAAAKAMDMKRADWLKWSIMKSLGEDPELSVPQKLSELSERVSAMEGFMGQLAKMIAVWPGSLSDFCREVV